MITVRKSDERGIGRHGWLTTRHTFSFADYHDPEQMGFRTLRVINQDVVEAARGFGAHAHQDMEIVSIVLSGALAHEDSTGGQEVLRPGEVQRMTAGTGVVHSEFNGSKSEPVHFFQVWILPERRGLTPGYEQKTFPMEERRGTLRLLVDPEGADGALTIHQDARVYASILAPGQEVAHELAKGRGAWVQVARGTVTVNGTRLGAGDGAAIETETTLRIAAGPAAGGEDAEFLLFDLK